MDYFPCLTRTLNGRPFTEDNFYHLLFLSILHTQSASLLSILQLRLAKLIIILTTVT